MKIKIFLQDKKNSVRIFIKWKGVCGFAQLFIQAVAKVMVPTEVGGSIIPHF